MRTTVPTIALAALLLLAAGCAPGARPVSPPGTSATTQTAAPSVTATAPADGAPLSAIELSLDPMWRGLDQPLDLVNAGDGSNRLFVVEQTGKVRVISQGKVLPDPYLDLTDKTKAGGEQGLLGIAFAPDFKTNGRVYVNYTDVKGTTVVARYVADDPASNTPAWAAPQVVLKVKQPYANHNGGNLVFGPDRMLYVGLGDGGSAGDPGKRAQNPAVLLGKMLRLDTGDAAGGTPKASGYAIPADNPFVGRPGYRPEIWQTGLRNPWRYSFDASTGAMWIGDVGQDAWEEIDVTSAGVGGQNFGWSEWEGTHPYPEGASPSRKGVTFPVLEYSHLEGDSVTGGYVYRGDRYPELRGTYLYGDFGSGFIGGIKAPAAGAETDAKPEQLVLLKTKTMPASFGVDEAGEMYVVDYNGVIWAVRSALK